MQSPLPNPEPGVCPRCGTKVGQTNSPYCPSCGALLKPATKSVSGLKIFGAICLGLLALPLAGIGACFLLLSSLGGVGASSGNGQIIGGAIACLLVALLMFAGMIALIIKR